MCTFCLFLCSSLAYHLVVMALCLFLILLSHGSLPLLCTLLKVTTHMEKSEITNKNIANENNASAVYEIDRMTVDEILAANKRRNLELEANSNYNPITGLGSCAPRVEYRLALGSKIDGSYLIPEAMADELKETSCTTAIAWEKLRIRHDFEYWCATCVNILDKVSGRLVTMVLNRPQRRVLAVLERQRRQGKPLRLIMLKARQWGGSTLVQVYMAWIQLVLKSNWNSLICGHLHQTSAGIKGMYQRLLRGYPKRLSPGGKQPQLLTYEDSRHVRKLSTGESLVISCSALTQDAVRGYDVKMAHLSEVAFWPDSEMHHPDDVIRSISGTLPMLPLTLLVMESTANGVGNYFHNEWIKAKAGLSDKAAVFVPWYEIEIYRMPVTNPHELLEQMDNYEKWLWQDCHCTLEMINWYHSKRKEYSSPLLMAAEFPTTDIEAFTSTSRNVFTTEMIESLRENTRMAPLTGDIVARTMKSLDDISFVEMKNGPLEVWRKPENTNFRNRYIVVVDLGGNSPKADWSVIAVFDRHTNSDMAGACKPEVVAQWRGHLHHDELAWKAAQIAKHYSNALLVFESNSIESKGEVGNLIFKQIMIAYKNVFMRNTDSGGRKPGFQTNRETKPSAIYNLFAYVRDGSYIEHDNKALDEMACYELQPNGKSYGAASGKHDDIVMTRAIGLYIIEEMRLAQGRSRAGSPDFFIDKNRPVAHP